MDFPTVISFLKDARTSLAQSNDVRRSSTSTKPHLVLGNPAGDADSIISAIGLAYIDSIHQPASGNYADLLLPLTIPIVSISIQDLKTQRPETSYLLKQCVGMTDDDLDALISIHQSDVLPREATLTLVDHNHHYHGMDDGSDNYQWTVTEMVDHHKDEGHHTETCVNRNIAFEESHPLVASTCSMVVERFYERHNSDADMVTSWPPTLAILLLGVILLDSINMLPGKGMPRDGAAIEKLLRDTDWTQLDLPKDIVNDVGQPDCTKLFETLQGQKFSPEFWNSLTGKDAIRMDYKTFPLPKAAELGIATILQDMATFQEKEDAITGMASVIYEDALDVLGLMFTFMNGDGDQTTPRRQLMLASLDPDLLSKLVRYLTEDTGKLDVDLQLSGFEMTFKKHTPYNNGTVYFVAMDQGNASASRKQVAPILASFWKNENGNEEL
jgi:exopolyphosphatase